MSHCRGCAMLAQAEEAQENMIRRFLRLDMGPASAGSSPKLYRVVPIICRFGCPMPHVIHTCRAPENHELVSLTPLHADFGASPV